ncbi:hypothetical protein [Rhodopseudomonas palustris]|uniref:Uncharacterized protein n=1 Tax=Rhodopseudomonas palustris (strain BisB18) TaxID=316056 RepID=Q20YC2_RHOPB
MVAGITGITSNYPRASATYGSTPTWTRTDALPEAPAKTESATSRYRVDVSKLIPLQATLISVADIPELRDVMAANWLRTQSAEASPPAVSDDASQKTYAQVKVDGKVVVTLDNGGCSTMSNAAAAMVGKLQDPPGLSGPNLAQWRADSYAKLLGGTVEKAPTAITQSQFTPHQSWYREYSRDELDAAYQAMLADGQKASSAGASAYSASQTPAGRSADRSA